MFVGIEKQIIMTFYLNFNFPIFGVDVRASSPSVAFSEMH
jgi:hypothetical protein